ncbi:MAG TPA: hypothetical protein VFH73_15015 [Polyangia bacterium]|nr:hypothetical protein [Polyangia bacterium]
MGCPRQEVLSGEGGFLKGQLHLHSNNSGDSATPPGEVVRWYQSHGYDFIVFTDHERVTTLPSTASMLVIPGVELTQNLKQCEPPPPPGLGCLLHVNALFVPRPPGGAVPWPPAVGIDRIGRYRRALAVTKALAGIAQLNHPNYDYSADAPLVAQLAGEGLTLLEIANEASDSNNDPQDGRHPSTEAIWDAALTAGATVFGTATDDAHHYDDATAVQARGEPAFVGDRGFVMVRARKDPGAIRAALERGDFYASTGVVLKRIDRTAASLEIEVADRSPGSHRFAFIGSGAQVLARAEGRRASFRLADAAGGYARAVVVDSRGRKAWVQPVRVP